MILSTSNLIRRESSSQQENLFVGGSHEPEYAAIRFTSSPEWSQTEKMSREFEALGLHLSAHPLDQYAYQLSKLKIVSSALLDSALADGVGRRIYMAGQLTSVQERVSQKGNRFAFLQFTDQSGIFEMTCFSELLASSREKLQEGNVLIIRAEAKVENGVPRLLAQRIDRVEDKIASAHSGIGIWVETDECLQDIKSILSEDGAGRAEVEIYIKDRASRIKISLPHHFQLSGECREKLKTVPGILKIQDIMEIA